MPAILRVAFVNPVFNVHLGYVIETTLARTRGPFFYSRFFWTLHPRIFRPQSRQRNNLCTIICDLCTIIGAILKPYLSIVLVNPTNLQLRYATENPWRWRENHFSCRRRTFLHIPPFPFPSCTTLDVRILFLIDVCYEVFSRQEALGREFVMCAYINIGRVPIFECAPSNCDQPTPARLGYADFLRDGCEIDSTKMPLLHKWQASKEIERKLNDGRMSALFCKHPLCLLTSKKLPALYLCQLLIILVPSRICCILTSYT